MSGVSKNAKGKLLAFIIKTLLLQYMFLKTNENLLTITRSDIFKEQKKIY